MRHNTVLFSMNCLNFRELDVSSKNLNFWFENNMNVLMFGKHGVGKTTMIKSCFEYNGLVEGESYKTFSGSTLDPWIDFIGIPKKESDNATGKDYIDYVRPKYMDGDLQAIFMDEYNRTPKSVRNALMELIQFKSINGKAFPNLRFIWAACNPDTEDSYDVEELDPAQIDRFHILISIPYKPSLSYFTKKYGNTPAKQAIEWWKNQPTEAKNSISPRRLEYVLDYFYIGGDIAEMLPINSDVSSLKENLILDSCVLEFQTAIKTNDIDTLKRILNDENNFDSLNRNIFNQTKYYNTVGLYLKEERLIQLILENDNFLEWSIKNRLKNNKIKLCLFQIYNSIEKKSDSKNKTKYDIISEAFNYGEATDNVFLVLNDRFKTKNLNGDGTKKSDLEEFKEKLNNFMTYFTSLSEIADPSEHWKRCLISIPSIKIFDKEACDLFLNYFNLIVAGAFDKDWNTKYPEFIEVFNSIILKASDMGWLSESSYFITLRESIKRLKELQCIDKICIKETDIIEIGDTPLNISGSAKKFNLFDIRHD